VQLLLAARVSRAARAINDQTPLHMASRVEIARLLVADGADAGCSALAAAAATGDVAALRDRLSQLPPDAVSEKDDFSCTALHLAVNFGQTDCAELLLRMGAPSMATLSACGCYWARGRALR
jgi:ankyrin repeat protein